VKTAATIERQRAREIDQREQAALRRLAAHMRAEAAELEERWVAHRIGPDAGLPDWGERVIPELSALMSAEGTPTVEPSQAWVRHRTEGCPLSWEEEACLRRTAALLRAEAAELGEDSEIGRRFDRWGSQLAVECEDPSRPPRIV
jgi:hypothetical protein